MDEPWRICPPSKSRTDGVGQRRPGVSRRAAACFNSPSATEVLPTRGFSGEALNIAQGRACSLLDVKGELEEAAILGERVSGLGVRRLTERRGPGGGERALWQGAPVARQPDSMINPCGARLSAR